MALLKAALYSIEVGSIEVMPVVCWDMCILDVTLFLYIFIGCLVIIIWSLKVVHNGWSWKTQKHRSSSKGKKTVCAS